MRLTSLFLVLVLVAATEFVLQDPPKHVRVEDSVFVGVTSEYNFCPAVSSADLQPEDKGQSQPLYRWTSPNLNMVPD